MADGATWQACYGDFYDSGGAAGTYSDNENMTAILEPCTGAGSGPMSRITFLEWALDAAGNDTLFVYDGQSITDPLIATGHAGSSLLGSMISATGASGCLTFRWTSDGSGTGAGWRAHLGTGPDPGGSGSLTVCSDASAFDLFAQLTGTPDVGGEWSYSGSLVSNTYTPGTQPAGIYTYTVHGVPPVPDSSATVTVTEVPAANAGLDQTIAVCSSDASFSMRSQLLGTSQSGGAWTGPLGPHADQFNPASDTSGVYVYVVAGNAPCVNDTAKLTITVRKAADAGSYAPFAVCSNGGSVDLFTYLAGTPDAGGSWTAPGGGAHSGTFQPGVDVVGRYIYTVTGQSPCANDTASVRITVRIAPNSGASTNASKCSNSPVFNIFNLLIGAATGGTWSGPTTVPANNMMNPATMGAGVYTYTVNGQAPCAPSSSTVNVTINAQANAGTNGTKNVCSNGTPVDLFSKLGGTPNGGGAWTFGGVSHSGTFTPGTDTPGVYTYTVTGITPCANASATVTINQIAAPNAGTNGAVSLCSTSPPESLIAHLGGSPPMGGIWTKPAPGGTMSGTYDPSNPFHPAGGYTYTVAGTAPCPNATAIVTVTENLAPNAGTNASITICSTHTAFSLFTLLGGNPDNTGAWLGPTNQPTSSIYTPGGTSAQGVYKYIVNGSSPCVNDTGFVMVTEHTQPDAGLNGSTSVCSNASAFPLFPLLGGTPDTIGTWKDPIDQSSNGTFTPGSSLEGSYTYTLTGIAPCINATATVMVNEEQLPNAGSNGSTTRCSDELPFNMIDVLNGSPNAGGIWSPGDPSGLFSPLSSIPGTYTYTVNGVSPCPNSSANVNVFVVHAPYAGSNGDIPICSAQTAWVDLFTGLGGNWDAGGTWTDNGNTGHLHNNQYFDPAGLPPGNYEFTYDVPGVGQCGPDEAEVQVTITPQFDAGCNGNTNLCSSNPQFDLFNGIGCNPQQGGTWIDLDNTGRLSNLHFFNATGLSGTFHFKYRLTGSLGCPADSSTATINVTAAVHAGQDTTKIFCSDNSTSFNLLQLLVGVQGSGVWRKPTPGPFSGSYIATIHDPGDYRYIVFGSGPCPNDTAHVIVTEVTAANAGCNSTITKCISSPPFNMTQALGCNPDLTGTWISSLGQAHNSTFTPGFDPPGLWLYTVIGAAPCGNNTASLLIAVNDPPNAGCGRDTSLCANIPTQVFLFSLLGCGAQFGGFWLDPMMQSHDGYFHPLTDPSGTYTYVKPGIAPCGNDSAQVTIEMHNGPFAGINASVSFCSNNDPVDLSTYLGSPDPGGTWVGPGNTSFTGTFTPGASLTGTYVYTVVGIPPCGNASAAVTVAVTLAPNAGCSAVKNICSNASAFLLVDQLTCSPTQGGSWTAPLGGPSNGLFTPGSSTPGIYTYTPPINSPCDPVHSTVTVNVNTMANAGSDGAFTRCSTDGQVNLFTFLGGNPQTGGTWKYNNQPHSNFFAPSVDPSGIYIYLVNGVAPCVKDSAIVNATVNYPPNAGTNGTTTICDNAFPFLLISVLNGSPSPFGSWTGISGAPHSNTFIPGVDTSGVYTYTVTGLSPCPNGTALATVNVYHNAHAGDDVVHTGCSDESNFLLFNLLGGTPDAGGSWLAPDLSPFNGLFVPGTSVTGVYTYVVNANIVCTSDTSRVNVLEFTAPNAGISTAPQVCKSTPHFDLSTLLAGTPDGGGTWTDPLSQPHTADFDPMSDQPGIYTYTVHGFAPCTDKTATVLITLIDFADPGGDGTRTVCTGATNVDLFPALLGSPQSGGTWNDDDVTNHLSNGIFDASSMAIGVYHFTYTVAGVGICPDSSATVSVTVTNALDAGSNDSTQACHSESSVNLFQSLGGTPQTGGIWHDVDNTSAVILGIFNATQVGVGTYHFNYVLPGSAGCSSDSATVTVQVIQAYRAGCDGAIDRCDNTGPVSLFTGLTCAHDNNGIWYDPGHVVHSSTLTPATDPPGTYQYIVPPVGICPADTANVVVTITAHANAGTTGNLPTCSNGDPVDMFNSLGGSPQSGGAWTDQNSNPHSNLYSPAFDNPQNFTYTLIGQGSCGVATAVITVTENQQPNAGCGNTWSVCSNQSSSSMLAHLACFPQSGGTWTDPNGVAHGDTFVPGTDIPGNYTYTKTGIPPCASAQAILTVTVTQAPFAGVDSTLSVCATNVAVDLCSALGGADPGGTWVDVNNTGAFANCLFDATQVAIGTYTFTYSVLGNGPCPADVATLVVNVGAGLDPGIGGSDTICGGNSAFNLFSALGGSHDIGGIWTDGVGTGALVNDSLGVLNATVLVPGSPYPFSYTVGNASCGEASATIMISVSPYPDPGSDSSIVVCINSASFDLFTMLGGSPEAGGTWRRGATAVSSTFNPATDPSGVYIYRIIGTPPCVDTTARVTVQVNQPPNAGSDGQLSRCNIDSVDLRLSLSTTAQVGGTWTDVDNTGQVHGNYLVLDPLIAGDYHFKYTVTVAGCGSDVANVVVHVVDGVRITDTLLVCDEVHRTYTVTITIANGDPTTYVVTGALGTLTQTAPYVFTSAPYFTSEPFSIRVDDSSHCTPRVVEGVSPCHFTQDVFVPESFTPNGDNANDLFVIPGIEGFPRNSIAIFNRWGSEVYSAAGYDNKKVVWGGTSKDALIPGDLPTGTYYYVLELGDGRAPFKGFVYLNR